MDAGVSEPRSRFANSPETLRRRASRAQLRRLCAEIVGRRMREFASALRRQSRLHAIALDDSGRIASSSFAPSDQVCMILDVEMLLAEVRAAVHPSAPLILAMESRGVSWEAIAAKVGASPVTVRMIFLDAVAYCICDERTYPDLKRDEAA